ncbi:transmembrane and death domain protein 1 [Apteryx mantelli]|uniref:Transmembrane and death domain protein 1 n=1 Tax=Apteryx mantelli TaxID=2696672 RepID=A0ABM4FYM9_9AVES
MGPGGPCTPPWLCHCEELQNQAGRGGSGSPRAMLVPAGLGLLLLAAWGRGEDAVAAVLGRHAVDRLVRLLSPAECRQLRAQLAGPDGDLERELEQLSEARNPLARVRRAPANCATALRRWLGTAGAATPWDRLSRGLRHVGRPDVARELGKNLNQDRSLELRRNVEGYGRAVARLASSLLLEGDHHRGGRARRAGSPIRSGGPPPYARSLLGWVGPLASGVLGGFLASVVLLLLAAACSRRRVPGWDGGCTRRRDVLRESEIQ